MYMTAALRVYIVDDETPARRELRYLLELAGVSVVGEAGSSTTALQGIQETKPQLVFLDIQMPGVSGLEMARFLNNLAERPLLVFATAFDEHALEAFEVDALDYLCKPFTFERIGKTVAKAIRVLAAPGPGHNGQPLVDPCRRVPLYRGEIIVPTAPGRIIFAHAAEGEVVVHTVDGRYHTRMSLGELERRLAAAGFVRPHRSYLVNSNHVREVIPWFNRSYNLIMDDTDKTRIPVSRHQAQELKKHFDL
jgi:two-component system, LytTR family, response regulator LytT